MRMVTDVKVVFTHTHTHTFLGRRISNGAASFTFYFKRTKLKWTKSEHSSKLCIGNLYFIYSATVIGTVKCITYFILYSEDACVSLQYEVNFLEW